MVFESKEYGAIDLEVLKSYGDERIAHLCRQIARGFNRLLARQIAQYDVTLGQWIFLRILWKQDGLTQRDLSEIANLTEPTTHTALIKLEKLGLIDRRSLETNKRRQRVFLTEKGRALEETLVPVAIALNDVALAGIPSERQDILRSDLIAILSNLTAADVKAEADGLKVPATRHAQAD